MEFRDLAKSFIETSYNLLLIQAPGLLSLKDMFINYNENANKPYTLSILIQLGISDLEKIIQKNQNLSLNLKSFFPIFKDSI